jgi:hypothetical protein
MSRKFTNLPFWFKISLLGLLVVLGKYKNDSLLFTQYTHNMRKVETDTSKTAPHFYNVVFELASVEK